MSRLIYSFKDFLKKTWPHKVRKLPLHTHLGCPHKNAAGIGGCVYCYNPGFSRMQPHSIKQQILNGFETCRQQAYTGKYIAYFQTETNTNAKPDTLRALWQPVLDFPDNFVAISVSTRPDCIDRQKLDILNEFHNNGLLVWVELGLQSMHNETLMQINRGHTYETFLQSIELIKSYPFRIVVHLILGLPEETFGMMKSTIKAMNSLPVHGLKLHHLQVPIQSELETWYREGRVTVYRQDAYIALLWDLIPFISYDKVIHRLFGGIHKDHLVAPKWTFSKPELLRKFMTGMKTRHLMQGCKNLD